MFDLWLKFGKAVAVLYLCAFTCLCQTVFSVVKIAHQGVKPPVRSWPWLSAAATQAAFEHAACEPYLQ